MADFFVTGVEHQVGKGSPGGGAPVLEFGVELGGALTDLGGTDGGAAELFDNGGDFAGGDALNIHFGHGEFEGLFAAHAFFQGAGIEVQFAADLRDPEVDGADAGGEGLGFEAVGVALAGFGAFVGLGLERVMRSWRMASLTRRRRPSAKPRGALVSQELQNGVQEFRIALVGHCGFELDVFADTPTGNQRGPPSTSFSRAERLHPSGVRLRSARYARLRSASPRRGGGGGKKDNLQKEIYTPSVANKSTAE